MKGEKSLEESAEKRDWRVVLREAFCATMVGFIIKLQVLSLAPASYAIRPYNDANVESCDARGSVRWVHF